MPTNCTIRFDHSCLVYLNPSSTISDYYCSLSWSNLTLQPDQVVSLAPVSMERLPSPASPPNDWFTCQPYLVNENGVEIQVHFNFDPSQPPGQSDAPIVRMLVNIPVAFPDSGQSATLYLGRDAVNVPGNGATVGGLVAVECADLHPDDLAINFSAIAPGINYPLDAQFQWSLTGRPNAPAS